MNRKQRRTLADVFETPTRSDIAWADIESLFKGLGGTVTEGRGSRVRVHLSGMVAVFHRPHPEKEAKHYLVKDVREFLERCGWSKDS